MVYIPLGLRHGHQNTRERKMAITSLCHMILQVPAYTSSPRDKYASTKTSPINTLQIMHYTRAFTYQLLFSVAISFWLPLMFLPWLFLFLYWANTKYLWKINYKISVGEKEKVSFTHNPTTSTAVIFFLSYYGFFQKYVYSFCFPFINSGIISIVWFCKLTCFFLNILCTYSCVMYSAT